ncbi:uncharacterized protein LOC144574841 [Carex rostrata]
MSVLYNRLRRLVEQIDLYNRLPNIVIDMALSAAISELTAYVAAMANFCWNQATVQEMRRKFQGLLLMAKRVLSKLARHLSNTANLFARRLLRGLQQFLRALQNEARQGIQLLAGLQTHVLHSWERVERIRAIVLELNDFYLRNGGEAGVHPRIRRPPFKPRYLRRRTRFQVIFQL